MSVGHGDLRQNIGGVEEFFLMDLDSGNHANVVVKLANLTVPNASYLDQVVVQFDCTQGELETGNIATEIRRQ